MKKNCSKNPSSNLGFSLVELLFTLSLIALLFSLGIAQYNRFNRSQTLTRTKDELVSNLRLAQSKAMVAEKPSGCGEEKLEGHRLEFINNYSYKIVAVCNCIDCPEVKAAINFPSNIVKQSGPDEIFFKVLNRGIEFVGSQPPLVLSLVGSDETQMINLTTAGEIK
jgi:prepilin-type N-terminal cleavage/methylation domain-containing protein